MLLNNCEKSLVSTWSENYFLTDIRTHIEVAAQEDDPARPKINASIKAKFKIKDTKLYVLLVALSTKDDNKHLEQLKSGCKRTIK